MQLIPSAEQVLLSAEGNTPCGRGKGQFINEGHLFPKPGQEAAGLTRLVAKGSVLRATSFDMMAGLRHTRVGLGPVLT